MFRAGIDPQRDERYHFISDSAVALVCVWYSHVNWSSVVYSEAWHFIWQPLQTGIT